MNRSSHSRIARLAALVLLVSGQIPCAYAQHPHRQGPGGQMSQEDRRRLRDELNAARGDVYKGQRERPGQNRGLEPVRGTDPGRLSPEERGKLRRDIEEANRGLPPRR
ncbi:MAG: hypothetical protein HY017_06535 [Betaproteobacteria bacterium]|nr:hypothetical protein [Betaproteobacteria bacterium]